MLIPESLFELELVDGYTTKVGETEVVYKHLTLRETNVGDEMAAVEKAQKAVKTAEGWKLLTSDDVFSNQMTLQSIKVMRCPNHNDLSGSLLSPQKFSSLDWAAIQQRQLLVELSAQLRHDLISQKDFDKALEQLGLNPASDSSDQAQEVIDNEGRPGRQTEREPEKHRQAGKIERLE